MAHLAGRPLHAAKYGEDSFCFTIAVQPEGNNIELSHRFRIVRRLSDADFLRAGKA
jgi:hypothetical protein